MALATQAQLERHLQIDVTAEPDPVVAEYLAQAQAACEAWAHQPLEYTAAISESFEVDQVGEAWHILDRFPVTAAPTVVEDTVTLTETTDFLWYEDGRLWRIFGERDGAWSTKPGGVVVTYNAGFGTGAPSPYDSVPVDLSLAIVVYAAALFRHGAAYAAQGPVPVSQIALDGSDTIQYAVNSKPIDDVPLLSPRSKQLLGPYMRRFM
jgi:hypothetical protein